MQPNQTNGVHRKKENILKRLPSYLLSIAAKCTQYTIYNCFTYRNSREFFFFFSVYFKIINKTSRRYNWIRATKQLHIVSTILCTVCYERFRFLDLWMRYKETFSIQWAFCETKIQSRNRGQTCDPFIRTQIPACTLCRIICIRKYWKLVYVSVVVVVFGKLFKKKFRCFTSFYFNFHAKKMGTKAKQKKKQINKLRGKCVLVVWLCIRLWLSKRSADAIVASIVLCSLLL